MISPMTSPKLSLLALITSLSVASGCAETTVTFLTQAPPGRTTAVDTTTETLEISRGLAVAFECVEWTDAYSGPCRDMTVVIDDTALAEQVPAHLDALAGQNTFSRQDGFDDSSTVGGPSDRQGGAVLALAEGETTLTVTTAGAPLTMTVVVVAPPVPPADEPAP